MADKSPKKPQSKKPGQTLKEKRAAKRAKRDGPPGITLPTNKDRRG